MFRKKIILFFKVNDYWFDKKAFTASKASISIFHGQDINGLKFALLIKDLTFMIDLGQTEDQIFAKFDKKGLAYSIRNAEKKGIKVSKANNKEVEQFQSFFEHFAENKGIPSVTLEELEEMDVFVAYSPENTLIGGTAFVKSEDKSIYRYKHGANVYSTNANDLLLWSAIKAARRDGFSKFDLGGVKANQKKDSYYYRHYKFKEKFGGDLVEFYTCIKSDLLFLPILYLLNFVVHIFFKDDFNSLVNFINKIKNI